jgi:hypothetical protein
MHLLYKTLRLIGFAFLGVVIGLLLGYSGIMDIL